MRSNSINNVKIRPGIIPEPPVAEKIESTPLSIATQTPVAGLIISDSTEELGTGRTLDYQSSILKYLAQNPCKFLSEIEDKFFALLEYQLAFQLLKKYVKEFKVLPSKISLKQYTEEQISTTHNQLLTEDILKNIRQVVEDIFEPVPIGDQAKIQKTLLEEIQNKTTDEIFFDFSAGKLSFNQVAIKINKLSTLDSEVNNKFLKDKTMRDWMKEADSIPIPKMIFSELWHEGELCILFSYTGYGKSVLAYQIADAISKEGEIPGFTIETEKQDVLYFDFELSSKQLQARYSNGYKDTYQFDPMFHRVEPDVTEAQVNGKFEDYLLKQIEQKIIDSNTKIIFIDNLTYLRGDVEKAKDALPFMKKLNELKKTYDLSILVLAHTPKRNASLPLTLNDLAGSSTLSGFCSSCFAIGTSTQDKNVRYIKQLKQRYTENIYGNDNVILCRLEQPDNFLRFTHIGYGDETDYLKSVSDEEKQVMEENVIQLHKNGKSYREIGKELSISLGKVQRIISRKQEMEKQLIDI